MFEFTLFKSLFFEMDKHKMTGITETKEKQITSRRLEVNYESVPEITSITSQERILPYVDRYYFFVNDEKVPVDLKDNSVKQVIYEFYKEKFPAYLKADVPDSMEEVDILDVLEPFNMPDYRPKHAFPGIITLEDIRNGNIHDEDKPKYAFPGLELLQGKKPGEADKPMAASYEGYTAFNEDEEKAREEAKSKLEVMKAQFADQMGELNKTLESISKKETEE